MKTCSTKTTFGPSNVRKVLTFFTFEKSGHLQMAFMNHCFLRKQLRCNSLIYAPFDSTFLHMYENKDQYDRRKSHLLNGLKFKPSNIGH